MFGWGRRWGGDRSWTGVDGTGVAGLEDEEGVLARNSLMRAALVESLTTLK